MATLRNKRKLTSLNKENHEEHPKSNQARYSNVPRTLEDYITQVSEKIAGRVTKKLSLEFSRIESRISDALSKSEELVLKTTDAGSLRIRSGDIPEYTWRKPGND